MSLYHRFHDRFGSAAVVIAVIALIAALGGSALAARGGLSRKEKKEIKKYALVFSKRFAKRFAKPGPEGQQGAAGEKGATGDTGAPGENGKPGEKGEPGESVAMTELFAGECTNEEGGAKLEVGGSAVEVCNGEKGEKGNPWTAGGTLPSEKTETGAWSYSAKETTFVPISFAIPLAAELGAAHVHFLGPEAGHAEGEGEVTENSSLVKGLTTSSGKFTAGEEISGAGIPAGTLIKVANNGGTELELTAAATATSSGTETLEADLPADCEGGTTAEPKAKPGSLCVYAGVFLSSEGAHLPSRIFTAADPNPYAPREGAGKAGSILEFPLSSYENIAAGQWAVTAP